MNRNRNLLFLLVTSIMLLLVGPVAGQEGTPLAPTGDAITEESTFQGDVDKTIAGLLSANGEGRRFDPSQLTAMSVIVTFDPTISAQDVANVSGGQIVHEFKYVFNGASLVIAQQNLDNIASLSGVTGIYYDSFMRLDTETSPGFIGAPVLWDQLGGQSSAGEGTIVGILDSGVWPEHPSFSDPDPFGNAFPAPPTVPGSNGFAGPARPTCDFGNTAFNPNDAPFTCNNKLIGAYDFTDTYNAVVGLLPTEFDSARDADGHGNHTATTAAGNGGVSASILGAPLGTVSGIAPRAHVIAYKVCGDAGCYQSDSVAAVEQAILDHVDVINFSISGGENPYSDAVELAFSVAYENGVFIAASGGNSGPGPDTVAHRGPWTMTVAASLTNRAFENSVTFIADNGDTLTVNGASVTGGIATPTDVVFAADYGNALCNSAVPFNASVAGKIVICLRGGNARVDKSFAVSVAGGAGMVLYNPVLQGTSTDSHFVPSTHLENDAGALMLDFMATHTGVQATMTNSAGVTIQGDVMAAFSSRGGPNQTLGISKPDITAPGVQILAGHTPFPATQVGGVPGQYFQAISGTSMSSPHVAGSAALLAALHPYWTPGQIKSALMMSANADHFKEDGITPATPFDYGSGRVDLAAAGNVGLTISDTTTNFNTLQAELWNSNYPSAHFPVMTGIVAINRTLQSEVNQTIVWRTSVEAPADVNITVPRVIVLSANGTRTMPILIDASTVPLGEVRFATVYLTSHQLGQTLRFPISLVRRQPAITMSNTCDSTTLNRQQTTNCQLEITNTSFDTATVRLLDLLPRGLRLESVTGARSLGRVGFYFLAEELAGAQPPLVNVAVNPLASPSGYLPLSLFGIAPIGGVSDESITNFNVPAFEYAGEIYTRIGIVSNGYIVVGGGTGADVTYLNSNLPDADAPNNVLAPFWTDLNPSASGAVRIGVLTNGFDSWIIVDWASVPNYGDGETNSFQVWIGTTTGNPGQDISFTYGTNISDGDGGFLTVGAENKFGNSGGTVYFNGVGTPPSPSYPAGTFEVGVTASPGAPGETHLVDFTLKAQQAGTWTNCADLFSPAFQGANAACTTITVNR